MTPLHRAMIDAIVQSPAHILVTMRSKTEYMIEEDAKGRKVPRKIGVAPVQREGTEYEFDVYASADWSHQVRITKSRCSAMDGARSVKPGPQFWAPLFDWLKGGIDLESEFVGAIDRAESEPVLAAITAKIKTLCERRQIAEAARGRLLARYRARATELQGGAA